MNKENAETRDVLMIARADEASASLTQKTGNARCSLPPRASPMILNESLMVFSLPLPGSICIFSCLGEGA